MSKIKWKKVSKGLFGWLKKAVVWSLKRYLLDEYGLDVSKPSNKEPLQ